MPPEGEKQPRPHDEAQYDPRPRQEHVGPTIGPRGLGHHDREQAPVFVQEVPHWFGDHPVRREDPDGLAGLALEAGREIVLAPLQAGGQLGSKQRRRHGRPSRALHRSRNV